MSRLIMLPCAAFLRVYEPLSAFGPAERARWEAYATAASRPRRADSLAAERIEALRRIIALPPIVAPAQESPHAYVRWADGITYVCPWQTRLRSWLALGRLRATAGPLLADAFAPRQAQQATEEFVRWEGKEAPPKVYIQSSTWSVPQAWFVPFAPTERWLVLGSAAERDEQAARNSVGHPYAHLRDDYGPGAPTSGARACGDSSRVGAEAKRPGHRPSSGGWCASYDHDDPGQRRA